ncbi:hypothetical protein MRX96_008685 [Rhipicephalus microplus]
MNEEDLEETAGSEPEIGCPRLLVKFATGQIVCSTRSDDSGLAATGKRSHDAEYKTEPNMAAMDEPPAKTTHLPVWRLLIQPWLNISAERKTAETPPLPP